MSNSDCMNSTAITSDTNSEQAVQKAMARLTRRERRDSTLRSWCRRWRRAGSVAAWWRSSMARARSMMRASRLVSTASMEPTPVSRKTGATASWI
jgi:hypothetical protein